MRIRVLTLFPEMIEPVIHSSILGRATESGLIDIEAVDIRKYSALKHKNADDYPFGGGAGMVMTAQPICDCVDDVARGFTGRRLYMSPRGRTFSQSIAEELAREEDMVILCGHYEGVDQRALDICGFEEMSIGDYVLTGGELAAMVIVDAVARLVPGVLGSEESPLDESFSSGLLEYPQYTRPREYRGHAVPDVLLSGNHAHIARWRREQSLELTYDRRPEMLKGIVLDKKDRKFMSELIARREAERAEAARAEAERAEAEQAESELAEAEQAEATQVEVGQAEAEQAEATQVEATQVEVEQAEVEQAESKQVEATQTETNQAKFGQAESAQVESEQSEAE